MTTVEAGRFIGAIADAPDPAALAVIVAELNAREYDRDWTPRLIATAEKRARTLAGRN